MSHFLKYPPKLLHIQIYYLFTAKQLFPIHATVLQKVDFDYSPHQVLLLTSSLFTLIKQFIPHGLIVISHRINSSECRHPAHTILLIQLPIAGFILRLFHAYLLMKRCIMRQHKHLLYTILTFAGFLYQGIRQRAHQCYRSIVQTTDRVVYHHDLLSGTTFATDISFHHLYKIQKSDNRRFALAQCIPHIAAVLPLYLKLAMLFCRRLYAEPSIPIQSQGLINTVQSRFRRSDGLLCFVSRRPFFLTFFNQLVIYTLAFLDRFSQTRQFRFSFLHHRLTLQSQLFP